MKKTIIKDSISNGSEKMLSIPLIAIKLEVSTEFLRKKLQEKKYITKRDDNWTLTNKGLNSGGQYKNYFGRYIVFPETFIIPTNDSNKTLKDCRPMIFSHDAPNLIGAFYLFNYKPARGSQDDVSKLLLKFKDDNDFAVEQWIDTAVEESKHMFTYPIESIIRVLGHKEIKVKNKAKPLDKLGSAIATSLGSKYEAQTLSKKQKNQSLKFLSKENRENQLKEIYNYNPPSRKPKTILLIDDVTTTGTTITEVCRAIKKSSPKTQIYFLALTKTVQKNPTIQPVVVGTPGLSVTLNKYYERYKKELGKINVSDLNAFEKLKPYELGETNSKEAIPYLVKFLDKGGINEKRLAASGIQKLAKLYKQEIKISIPYLLRVISSPSPQVRQYALKALDSMDLIGVSLGKIKSLYLKDDKVYNQDIAKRILNKYNSI